MPSKVAAEADFAVMDWGKRVLNMVKIKSWNYSLHYGYINWVNIVLSN